MKKENSIWSYIEDWPVFGGSSSRYPSWFYKGVILVVLISAIVFGKTLPFYFFIVWLSTVLLASIYRLLYSKKPYTKGSYLFKDIIVLLTLICGVVSPFGLSSVLTRIGESFVPGFHQYFVTRVDYQVQDETEVLVTDSEWEWFNFVCDFHIWIGIGLAFLIGIVNWSLIKKKNTVLEEHYPESSNDYTEPESGIVEEHDDIDVEEHDESVDEHEQGELTLEEEPSMSPLQNPSDDELKEFGIRIDKLIAAQKRVFEFVDGKPVAQTIRDEYGGEIQEATAMLSVLRESLSQNGVLPMDYDLKLKRVERLYSKLERILGITE